MVLSPFSPSPRPAFRSARSLVYATGDTLLNSKLLNVGEVGCCGVAGTSNTVQHTGALRALYQDKYCPSSFVSVHGEGGDDCNNNNTSKTTTASMRSCLITDARAGLLVTDTIPHPAAPAAQLLLPSRACVFLHPPHFLQRACPQHNLPAWGAAR